MPPDSRIPPARKAALECIRLVLDQGQDIQAAVDHVFRKAGISEKDQRLATELSYGFIRHKSRLEHMVRFYVKKPESIQPAIMRILCLAAYELHFLDRVPAYASINWAVENVKQIAGQGLSRMANAVLRNIDRERARWVRPANLIDAPLKAWAVYFSMPQWILDLLASQYSREDLLQFCEAQTRPPALGIRYNWSKPQAQDLYVRHKMQYSPNCVLPSGLAFSLNSSPEIRDAELDGLISRQSISGQQMLWDLDFLNWPEPIFDASSGRGGKTLFLAEQKKLVWSGDTSLMRARGFKKECIRLGLPNQLFVLADATQPAPFSKTPGTFFLDAPCTGLGVLSRRPDSKWHRTENNVRQLIEIQSEMLKASAEQLAPGGLLMYMTCSLNKQENEQRIEDLLARNKRLGLEKQMQTSMSSPAGEFFYAAKIRKK